MIISTDKTDKELVQGKDPKDRSTTLVKNLTHPESRSIDNPKDKILSAVPSGSIALHTRGQQAMDTSSAMMFEQDTTVRGSCLAGNYVFWFSWRSIFAAPESGLTINDVREMKDGDFVTITNRVPDIPEWFTLHPTEVCNSLSYPDGRDIASPSDELGTLS